MEYNHLVSAVLGWWTVIETLHEHRTIIIIINAVEKINHFTGELIN